MATHAAMVAAIRRAIADPPWPTAVNGEVRTLPSITFTFANGDVGFFRRMYYPRVLEQPRTNAMADVTRVALPARYQGGGRFTGGARHASIDTDATCTEDDHCLVLTPRNALAIVPFAHAAERGWIIGRIEGISCYFPPSPDERWV